MATPEQVARVRSKAAVGSVIVIDSFGDQTRSIDARLGAPLLYGISMVTSALVYIGDALMEISEQMRQSNHLNR